MIVGVPKETDPGESRVALVPELLPKLAAVGHTVLVEPGAGALAGFPDQAYRAGGAQLVADAFGEAEVLLKVRPPKPEEVAKMREAAIYIGFLQPYANPATIRALAARRVTAFSMELMPRIARAQHMDALSAMSTVAGYKAVLIAASRLPRFFPLFMTAMGTLTPARVFVIGAGVAGLEAIGTAQRLGAIVEAYDTRPAVKEQVESMGARFVELTLDTGEAEDAGGYARARSEEFYLRQQQLMSRSVAAADVVITTALVPGQRAPVLITEEMVKGMRPGSVIVDLAAEQGGNVEGTEPGRIALVNGVKIIGLANLPATVPTDASALYARNLYNFLGLMLDAKTGEFKLDREDEIVAGTLVCLEGEVLKKG
jgi:NAD(P) transhydrogenase subunit alpha